MKKFFFLFLVQELSELSWISAHSQFVIGDWLSCMNAKPVGIFLGFEHAQIHLEKVQYIGLNYGDLMVITRAIPKPFMPRLAPPPDL